MAKPRHAAATDTWRPPRPWQPLTFRGVAAFSLATATRTYLVQFVVLVISVACLLQTLELTWWPAVQTAIQNLPPTGAIRRGQLEWPGEPLAILTDSQTLAILVDAAGRHESGQVADFQVEIAPKEFRFRCLQQTLVADYEPVWQIPLNKPELVPWWGAWKPAIIAVTAIVAAIALFSTWFLLASLYMLPLRLLAFVGRRSITFGGCWRIAAMALMPGALLLSLALLAYGYIRLPILVLAAIFVLHLILGWVYAFFAILHLDTLAAVAAAKAAANPFVPSTPPAQTPTPTPAPTPEPEPEPESEPEPAPATEPEPPPKPPRRPPANPFAAPEE